MAVGDGASKIIPSSATVAGSGSETVAISDDGRVTFTDCTSVSVNGVFTSTYRFYLLTTRLKNATVAAEDMLLRLRAAGTDATASSYSYNGYNVSNTSLTAQILTPRTSMYLSESASAQFSNAMMYLFDPAEAVDTSAIPETVAGTSTVKFYDGSGRHNVTTSYDGLTVFGSSSVVFSGTIQVFGMEK